MSNIKMKQLRKEVRKNADIIQMKVLSDWLSMQFKDRFILALKIIRGMKKGGRK
ncbi:MAG: hypothetical protein MJ181_11480 [Treponema sp.]|nr:hypothetical protein [Treponema sp.]